MGASRQILDTFVRKSLYERKLKVASSSFSVYLYKDGDDGVLETRRPNRLRFLPRVALTAVDVLLFAFGVGFFVGVPKSRLSHLPSFVARTRWNEGVTHEAMVRSGDEGACWNGTVSEGILLDVLLLLWCVIVMALVIRDVKGVRAPTTLCFALPLNFLTTVATVVAGLRLLLSFEV